MTPYFCLLLLLISMAGAVLGGCAEQGCSHECEDKQGLLAKCSCPEHMVLGPDKKTCSEAAQMLVGMFRGISLYSESTGEFQRLVTGDLTALDYHFKNKELFAYSKKNNSINKYSLASTDKKPTVTEVLKTETMVTSLAVDWVQEQLYWICEQRSAIETASLSGKNHRVVVRHNETAGAARPAWSSLVVDPYIKKLFWTGGRVIYSLDLQDGKVTPVSLPGVKPPLQTVDDLFLDTRGQRLYAMGSAGDKVLVKARYDGSEAQQVLSVGQRNSDISGFSVLGNMLYWHSNHDGENLFKTEIPTVTGSTKEAVVTLVEELYQIVFKMKVYHEDLQKPMK